MCQIYLIEILKAGYALQAFRRDIMGHNGRGLTACSVDKGNMKQNECSKAEDGNYQQQFFGN
jgi:hypothetical protein